MIIKAEDFKNSRVGKSILDPKEKIKEILDQKFAKGIIDAELYNKALAQLGGEIQKGQIMDKLGYGYGGSEALKFTKTGKELKEMLPGIIAALTKQRNAVLKQMGAFKTLAGIEPMDAYSDGTLKYAWSCCEQPYDEVLKQRPPMTEQNKACSGYNDCVYRLRSIDEDIVACKAIIAGADDKQKYNLSIGQLIALSGAEVIGKAEENDIEKGGTKGEGSRGGKVIGHTKSGEPIYESSKKVVIDHKGKIGATISSVGPGGKEYDVKHIDGGAHGEEKDKKKKQVKILGHTVTEGSKEHKRLLEQKRIFDQNAKSEG